MYAIFAAKGKQFRATPDQRIRMPSLGAEPGERVTFEHVLLAQKGAGEDVLIGRPTLEGASVAVEVLRHGREDKIIVYKMKRRKGYRRKQGHRQKFTEVKVVEIEFGTGRPVAATEEDEPTEADAPVAQPPEEPEAVEVVDAARATEQDVPEPDATPAAAELAEQEEIELAALEGTGKDGRILKGDVQAAIDAREED